MSGFRRVRRDSSVLWELGPQSREYCPTVAARGRTGSSRLAHTRKGARMFGRRKNLELQTVAAIREEMAAADMRARAVLSNAMALIELRLSKDQEERERE